MFQISYIKGIKQIKRDLSTLMSNKSTLEVLTKLEKGEKDLMLVLALFLCSQKSVHAYNTLNPL